MHRTKFQSGDGLELAGRIFGSGPTWLVLAHMGRSNDTQDDWLPLASALNGSSAAMLTFNRRGVCSGLDECSAGADNLGEHWQDVVGAVTFARSQGAKTIIIGGASIGAMASLAAVMHGLAVAGLIWFAGSIAGAYTVTQDRVQGISVPILILAADEDPNDARRDAELLFSWWTGPKELSLFPGRAHGTDVYRLGEPDAMERVNKAISEYISMIASTQG